MVQSSRRLYCGPLTYSQLWWVLTSNGSSLHENTFQKFALDFGISNAIEFLSESIKMILDCFGRSSNISIVSFLCCFEVRVSFTALHVVAVCLLKQENPVFSLKKNKKRSGKSYFWLILLLHGCLLGSGCRIKTL